jgi:DNA invertase Pin-like site-specific DNA recombinase
MFRDAVISILATIAKQEKVRIRERTIAGLERARRHGRIGGRPKRVVDVQKIQSLRAQGIPWPAIAQKLGVSIATVERRVRDAEGRTTHHEDQQAHRTEARSQDGTIQA